MATRTEPPLVIALPKGRLLGEAVDLLADAGYPEVRAALDGSRKLVHECDGLRVLLLRSSDIPTYVAYGAAAAGVAGRDVIEELGHDLYQPVDLRIGACRLVMAELAARPVDESSQLHLRVATKYPALTTRYLRRRGLFAEVIELSGAIELAPVTGLVDRIVDLVQSGETLRQNGLVEVATLMEVSARLVVNPAALKLHTEALSRLIDRVGAAVDRRGGGPPRGDPA
jgi:ATP phosphoribosyltransferase